MSERPITKADIQAKLGEIKSGVDEAGSATRDAGKGVVAAAGAAALGIVYLLGRRKGRKRRTVVEVRRF
jgi:hypothetical protein